MQNTDFINEYKGYLINEKHSSENTVASYIRDLKQYVLWLDDRSAMAVTSRNISAYLKALEERGKSKATISRCVATLKGFYAYFISKELIDKSPMTGIKTEKAEKKLPSVLSGEEVMLLLEQPVVTELKGCRDKAMLEMLYATGMRVSEMLSLDVDDVNLAAGVVRCHSSSGKERIVPMYPAAIALLSNYITVVREQLMASPDETALFVNMNGERMSRQGFWKTVKLYASMANIDKDITPHTMRHSFAAHLLENGADLNSIKEMLGHADISSTQVYVQVVNSKLRDVYNKSHPRA